MSCRVTLQIVKGDNAGHAELRGLVTSLDDEQIVALMCCVVFLREAAPSNKAHQSDSARGTRLCACSTLAFFTHNRSPHALRLCAALGQRSRVL